RTLSSASGAIRSASPGKAGTKPSSPTVSQRAAPPSSSCQLSLAILSSFTRVAIHPLLERCDAEAMHDVDKTLRVRIAALQVDLDQPLDHGRHFLGGER